MTLAIYRKTWNQGQKDFRTTLLSYKQHETALALFMRQHGWLHTAEVDPTLDWSYADEALMDVSDESFRRIPQNQEHSIAWCLWHLARIEDTAMNMLVAGTTQLLHKDGWYEKLQTPFSDTGNAMPMDECIELSNTVDFAALRAYRTAVGLRTREIVSALTVEDLKVKVDPAHLKQTVEVKAVRPEAQGLLDYWGKRDVAGLLLMPPTRHNMVHLNEIIQLKNRRR